MSYALFSVNAVMSGLYYAFFGAVCGCIAVMAALIAVFGRRARRNVKKESVTRLPNGFSPLDVKRIFIGKSYPRKLTRALLVYWAQRGYIMIEHVGRYTVKVHILEYPPEHDRSDALFFDRGTYVRERDLFLLLAKKSRGGKPVNILRPLFTKDDVKAINGKYAVREDEGVYSSKHYKLKIISLCLAVALMLLSAVWGCFFGQFVMLLCLGTALIGMFVLMFIREMPILFKAIWCGIWLGVSFGGYVNIAVAGWIYDPFYMTYISVCFMITGALFFIRFVDYRVKNNLAEYSDLVNYRKHLLFAPASELEKEDYWEALPFVYAFGIKMFCKRKFGERAVPEWYVTDGERGALL